MEIIIFKLSLVILAGIFNAIMDTLSIFGFDNSVFGRYSIFKRFKRFLDPDISWANKWKGGKRELGEKFPGSSTIFVFTTDMWHLSKYIMILCLVLVTINPTPIFGLYIDWFVYWVLFGFTFEVFLRLLSGQKLITFK